MANNGDFNQTVASLFKGMSGVITTKTVVGEPTQIGDTIIVPLVDVNFGMAAGAFDKTQKNSAAGGMSGKMSPSAVLVISNGKARMVSVKSTDTVSKIVDMVPDVVDKVTKFLKKDDSDEEIEEAIADLPDEDILF